MANRSRLVFGSNKYCALNQLFAKWLSDYGSPNRSYRYVTLGGTELRDVSYVAWINKQLTSKVLSYEQDPERHRIAEVAAAALRTRGIDATAIREDIFSYRREVEGPSHIYYLDLLGNCSPTPYRHEFKIWFENDLIRPGDVLFITSYLGRNPGWKRVLQQFDSEFRLLRVSSFDERKHFYNLFHPIFVLYRGMIDAGLQQELLLRCFGSVKYRDTSIMGLYGIACFENTNNIAMTDTLSGTPYFNSLTADWSVG